MIMPHLTGSHWINTDKPGGRVFFVGGDTTAAKGSTGSGVAPSDVNHGLNPDRAFATISQALTATTTNRGDTVVLLPGDLADISTALAISNNDITLTGIASQAKLPDESSS